ncbi:MAG: SDR family oxidoreductase [Candidatus Kapabacteria bacterium]|nr:SDR family oxidoreductase [Candidatus Kapabacteria bacterium]
MTEKTVALVTGANKGIGLETARQLALRGIRVVLSARDTERGMEAARVLQSEGLDVEFVRLDMEQPDDIVLVAEHIATTYGKLDILVNNAGIMIESDGWNVNTTATISEDALRRTMEVNFFGVVMLTQALLPLIRKSAAGRIVNVSSILGSLTFHATRGSNTYNTKTFAYNTSKAALNSFTIHLAHELRDTPVRVNSAHPGWVQTDMGGSGATLRVEEGVQPILRFALAGNDSPNGTYMHNDTVYPW